ncbi:MAG TPA: amidohydrolase family protein [Propionibacteriaceae bacterium]|nr:amidohydrolase family protein [Propionibacteriaceae bacterium]
MTGLHVWKNGRLLLGGSGVATALVVRDGVIVYVGGDDGACAWEGAGARVVDLGRRLVTPGFVDAHAHLVQTGQVMAGLDLARARSRVEVLDRVAEYARQHPEAGVIFGQGWDEGQWVEQRRPERAELDRAGGGVAVYLARVDVHSAVVSTSLLEQLPGIEQQAGFTEAGWVSQEAHHRCRTQVASLFTDEERRSAARAALGVAASSGLTSVHELGGPHLGPAEDLVRVREVAGEIGLDVVTYWGELVGESAIATARRVGAAGLAGDLCVDGAIGSRTAALAEPYADAPTRGVRYLSTEQITEHLVGCTRAGLQAGFHCIGDDAVTAALAGLRRATEVVGPSALRRLRHRLEHLEMVDEADISTLAELGVVASVQPAFDAAWGPPGELYEARLGRRRSSAMNRFATLHRGAVALAFGSDSPVTPLTGWGMVRAAVQHTQPNERLAAADAFAAATRGGHHAARVDDSGQLSVGWRADVAVWDEPAGAVGRSISHPVAALPELTRDVELPSCVLAMSRGRVTHDHGVLP